MESSMLNPTAHQNPSTLNPPTKASAIKIIRALITRRKRPKVSTVTGSVKISKIGFTKILSNAKIAATTRAVKKSETSTPPKILDNTRTMIAVRISCKRVFMKVKLKHLQKYKNYFNSTAEAIF